MKGNFKLNQVAIFFIISMVFLGGCVAAVPVAVYYYKTHQNHVAAAEVRKNADDLWLALLRTVEKRVGENKGQLKILKRVDTERLLEATDGIQTASVKIIPDGKRKSKLVITANVPEGKDKKLDREKELAARIMKTLCEEAEANCKLVETQ
jgi:hypothetical protein